MKAITLNELFESKKKKPNNFEKLKSEMTQLEDQIGFHEPTQKWYGWSHRAYYGFGIGDKIKKGDCGYEISGAWTAKTLDDAKQMAKNFAESVS